MSINYKSYFKIYIIAIYSAKTSDIIYEKMNFYKKIKSSYVNNLCCNKRGTTVILWCRFRLRQAPPQRQAHHNAHFLGDRRDL